jgi:hypothetical protein
VSALNGLLEPTVRELLTRDHPTSNPETDKMVYNVPAEETEPVVTSHINGSTEEILARYCITELCKGWPVYRDASEWKNYRSLFAEEGAYVWTSKPLTYLVATSSETKADKADKHPFD